MNFFNQFFIMKALELDEVTYVQLFNPTVIAYGFILSICFTNESHDLFDFIGSAVILIVNIGITYKAYKDSKIKVN